MSNLTAEDLYSLEEYAKIRGDFRAKVMAHKQDRKIHIGDNATLYFEDRLTMQYQIQEMLRIERIFEPEGIADELAAYNPLIPDGSNWKATLMVEYPDMEERGQGVDTGRGPGEGLCNCRRGFGARGRNQDFVGSFPTLRAYAGNGPCPEGGCGPVGRH